MLSGARMGTKPITAVAANEARNDRRRLAGEPETVDDVRRQSTDWWEKNPRTAMATRSNGNSEMNPARVIAAARWLPLSSP